MDETRWQPADLPVDPDWATGPMLEAGTWYSFGCEINPHTGEQTNWYERLDSPPEGGGFIEVTLESGEVLTYD